MIDANRPCLEVLIGGRPCPASRVVSDTTILAVCPPARTGAVPPAGLFVDAFENRLACRYGAVALRVKGKCKVGAYLASASFRPLPCGGKGTAEAADMLTTKTTYGEAPLWNLEYDFPAPLEGRLEALCKRKNEEWMKKKKHARRQKQENLSEDDRFDYTSSSSGDDFVGGPGRVHSTLTDIVVSETAQGDGDEDVNVVSLSSESSTDTSNPASPCHGIRLETNLCQHEPNRENPVAILQAGIRAFRSAKEQLDSVDSRVDGKMALTSLSPGGDGGLLHASPSPVDRAAMVAANGKERARYDDLENLAEYLCGCSDAAVMEDSVDCAAIPSLSGSARGFGAEMVDDDGGTMGVDGSIRRLRNPNAKP